MLAGGVVTTSLVWSLAEAFEVVPIPPTERLARLLQGWWTHPRKFGCTTAKRFGVAWHVVAPDSRIWCAECAAERLQVEARCCYCGGVIADDGATLVFEMRSVHVLARTHVVCHESEANGV